MQFIEAIGIFSVYSEFSITDALIHDIETIISRFKISAFQFEIFGQNCLTRKKEAHEHLIIEYKILQEEGDHFRSKIMKCFLIATPKFINTYINDRTFIVLLQIKSTILNLFIFRQ